MQTHSSAPLSPHESQFSSAGSIQKLSLYHFRNYDEAHIELDDTIRIVTLVGPNGAGKTNVLEAISLLSPGKGLRHAKLAEMLSRNTGFPATEWTLSGQIQKGEAVHAIGTGFASGGSETRRVRVDGETVRSHHELSRYLSVLWLTPAMSHLFSEGATARRKFLDRMVYGFDPEHASRIHAYEHHTRERNRLLAQYSPDPEWLSVLERKMAEYSVAIAAARLEAARLVNTACCEGDALFPAARLEIEGDAESPLTDGALAVTAEESLIESLRQSRRADKDSKRSGIGAHKTRVLVWFETASQEAASCSTGEQKALLLSLLLAQARAQRTWRGLGPVVLLDEVVAHLDSGRREALFAVLSELKLQAWLTGTDMADFSALKESRIFEVGEGRISESSRRPGRCGPAS